MHILTKRIYPFPTNLRQLQRLTTKCLISFPGIWKDPFFSGGPACLYEGTVLLLGALLSSHPVFECALLFPVGHLVADDLKAICVELLHDLEAEQLGQWL